MEKLDSRVADPSKRGLIQTPLGPGTRVHCVNCDKLGGVVVEEWAKFIIWLCDDCFFTNGHIPGLAEVQKETEDAFLLRCK